MNPDVYWILGGLLSLILLTTAATAYSASRLDNDRLRTWLNYGKFVFGTFALALVTTLINWQIQQSRIDRDAELKNKELQLAVIKQENENLRNYIDHALTKDLDRRRAFAKYFEYVSADDASRRRWREYATFIDNEIKEAERAKSEQQVVLKEQQKRIKNLEVQLLTAEKTNKTEVARLSQELAETKLAAAETTRVLQSIQAELKRPPEGASPITSFGWSITGGGGSPCTATESGVDCSGLLGTTTPKVSVKPQTITKAETLKITVTGPGGLSSGRFNISSELGKAESDPSYKIPFLSSLRIEPDTGDAIRTEPSDDPFPFQAIRGTWEGTMNVSEETFKKLKAKSYNIDVTGPYGQISTTSVKVDKRG